MHYFPNSCHLNATNPTNPPIHSLLKRFILKNVRKRLKIRTKQQNIYSILYVNKKKRNIF